MLEQYLVKKTLDYSFEKAKDLVKRVLNRPDAKLVTTREEIEESLDMHLRAIENWSGEISFNDLKKAKRTSDIFIELDLYVYPRRVWMRQEAAETMPLKEIFETDSHVVLLGQPGAGKTTSLKYLCRLLLHDEEFQKNRFSLPVLIRFRDFNSRQSRSVANIVTDTIFNILGLQMELPKKLVQPESKEEREAIRRKIVIAFLEELKILVLLDGFDEIASEKRRLDIISELNQIASHLSHSTIVLTSRSGDFSYRLENADHYEISPLSSKQIETFALKWLGNSKRASDFVSKVKKTPFADTAIRPLTLAHLCAIYERVKDIPEKPKTVYKKIINLLLEEWDQQRGIKRKSKYAHFEIDRKYEFLCHLAYSLTKTKRTVFSTDHLLEVYRHIYEEYGLKQREAKQVVSELETHTGLLLQSGYEEFEFAHKSLQEFLTAEYLVKLPTIPDNWKVLGLMPNELAIATAISSSPSNYFVELILRRLAGQKPPEHFVRAFLSRLLVEKPDFKTGIWVDLAMLVLYSSHLENNVIGKNQLELFRLDTVFKDFERIIENLRKSSLDTILQCYEPESRYKTDDHTSIFRVVRKKTAVAHQIVQHLPPFLYVRDSMFPR
jgi:Cdc6-like AAA superfamily ATPase